MPLYTNASTNYAPTVQRFTATGTTTGYLFTISTSSTCAVGDTYTNNSVTYTVLGALSAQTGQVMCCSGAGAPLASGTLTRASGAGTASITFTSNVPLATYTTPTSPRTPLYLRISVTGGGGGGGGSGTGSPSSGINGNSSFFGANVITALGGGAGTAAGQAGFGGGVNVTGATQIIAAKGNPGQTPDGTSITLNAFGGDGGANPRFGGAGAGGQPGGSAQSADTNSGAGGGGSGGAAASYAASGGGASGGYAEAFIFTPAATYSYVIGGTAAGGTGTTGSAGAGAAGQLVVEEFYQ